MIKTALKQRIHSKLWLRLSTGYHRLRRFTSDVEWRISVQGRQSAGRLRRFKDKHRGERCFLLGNGPSLQKMDLSPLDKEVTFGLNRIYLLFDRVGFSTTYYVAVNPYVIEQCAGEILQLAMPKFIRWDSHRHLSLAPDTGFIRTEAVQPSFSTDITRRLWVGATVTYAALQIAYYMGFSQVILVGVDHDFATKGPPGELVTSVGDDPNHFDPAYFGKGFQWQLPDLDTSELAYGMAKAQFERDDREILDATVGGKLQVFPKISYASLF